MPRPETKASDAAHAATGNQPIDVRPSAAYELEGALTRIRRSVDFGTSPDLGPDIVVPRELARRAATFWLDGVRNFGELAIIAHWAGTSFDTDPARLFQRLDDTMANASSHELGLASEAPDERALMAERIRRLAGDADLRKSYRDLLGRMWDLLLPVWNDRGRAAVERACEQWRRHVAGARLVDLLPGDHTVFVLDLVPLLEAGLARGEVVVSPSYFVTRGHVLDLAGMLSIGVMAQDQTLRNRYRDRGQSVGRFTGLIGNPVRAAMLSRLLEEPATADEIATELGISVHSVHQHLRRLRPHGLVRQTGDVAPARYVGNEAALERMLNDVSTQFQGGYGRSGRRRATDVAADASFRAIFDHAPIAMIQLDVQGHCLSCNGAAQRMFGYGEADIVQLRGLHLLAEEADHGAFELTGNTEADAGRRDVRLRRKDGTIFWGSVTISKVEDSQGHVAFGYAMIEAVSERQGGEDLVTKLPNRALFLARLERVLALRRRRGDVVAVLMLDLDRFKHVNDTLGHDAGDELLNLVAARLVSTLRATDVVGRLGGDEFAVLPMDASTTEALERVAEKIRAAIATPFELSGGRCASIGASVGAAIAPRDAITAADLMKHADSAMYAAKQASRGAGRSNGLHVPSLPEGLNLVDAAPSAAY